MLKIIDYIIRGGFRMKILDVSMKGNAIRLYLGNDSTDITKITGDDWNNVGVNATVYKEYVDKIVDLEIPFKDTVVSPLNFYENEDRLTKDQIKSRLVPLFAICYDTDKEKYSDGLNDIYSMNSLARWENKKVIFMGDNYEEMFQGEEKANHAHYHIGSKVRKAIKDIGGTMPEDLPTPKKSIKQIEKEHMKKLKEKARKNKLILDE